MKYELLALALTALPVAVVAEEPAATPDYTLTGNAGLVSNYYFRGQTQTWGNPAVQAGADYTHSSGFSAGTWLSNISGNQFAGGNLEWDLYGGYTYKVTDDWSLAAGLYYYYYPGANTNKGQSDVGHPQSQTYNTLEGNFGINWKWVGVKFSYAFTDYFSASKDTGYKGSTAGTVYPEININYPITDTVTLVAHTGYTSYSSKLAEDNANGKDNPSYADWKLGANYNLSGWVLGAYYVGASNSSFYDHTLSVANSSHKDLATNGGYLSVNKTF